MKPDIEIAQEAKMKPIFEIAKKMGVENFIHPYGSYKAKIDHQLLSEKKNIEDGKLVLVTAINPTPAGEGKTTTTVGLSDALQRLGKNVVTCLREPSLGPVFGVKGGAAGGGYAQILPMEDINLHFTGDIHAITAANNLLAAMLDNHIYQGNTLNIDPRRIMWRRALDMNDRQLRNVLDGLGGKINGVPREDGFDITVASEVMAVFCLAENIEDLKSKLSQMIVAYTYDDKPVTCGDLQAHGALTALLKDAFDPNLVQSIEHTPCLVHGGPFANIAHGCNSIIATKLALKLGDIVVTEAGFGADLGAEKFLDIKCRKANLTPSAVVLVATIRALKHHGGCSKDQLNHQNIEALQKGMPNLLKHIDNLKTVYGLTPVVAINQFPTDTPEEISWIIQFLEQNSIRYALSQVFEKGGEGGIDLAKEIIAVLEGPKEHFQFAYDLSLPIAEKISAVAQKIYGAKDIAISPQAQKSIQSITEMGFQHLPICIAKSQYSLSDNPALLSAPSGFTCQVRQVKLSAGAGFIVCLMGDIMTMPGLPKKPAAENIDVTKDGLIKGLF